MSKRNLLLGSGVLLVALLAWPAVKLLWSGYGDFACSIYPPGCPLASRSANLDLVHITLSTGTAKGSEFSAAPEGSARRIVKLDIPRAYLSWTPYIHEQPQHGIEFDAGGPDLAPLSLWMQQLNAGGASPRGTQAARHRLTQRVKITLSLTLDSNQPSCLGDFCGNTPVERGLNYETGTIFTEEVSSAADSFRIFRSAPPPAQGSAWSDQQLLIANPGQTAELLYMVCDIDPQAAFRWCRANSMLDKDLALTYEFEASRLGQFQQLDKQVRTLVKGLIISDQSFPESPQ
ncbi:hypothetical protein [Pseudomonas sp. 2FE]|uniref:hypothetical protein n=1 Tax=Pseudomonas sp. 2FE TaxID=2502190 RepID=UPI0010F5F757|nr:hypothetical protein [Pseudomonas sp. 2FE]